MSKPYRKMTYPMLKKIAASYETRADMRRCDIYAYRLMCRLGKTEECCAHMGHFVTPRKWTLEMLQAEAAKYSRRWEFQRASGNAYAAAARHGLLDQVCSHMPKRTNNAIVIAKPPGKHRYELLYAPPVALSEAGSPVVAGGNQTDSQVAA